MGKKAEERESVETGASPVVVDKGIEDICCTGDKLVCPNPCRVYSIVVCSLASSTNRYGLYDGQSTGGKLKLALSTTAHFSESVVFKHPMRFAVGLYVKFILNGSYVTIQYKPDY